jgi:hypothetical protein
LFGITFLIISVLSLVFGSITISHMLLFPLVVGVFTFLFYFAG